MNQLSSASTMKLSMIVTMTSCAPNLVLRYAGTAPTTPPAQPAAIMQRGSARMSGVPTGKREPGESGGESTRRELALASDVEQSGAQAERNRQAGERERRRLV